MTELEIYKQGDFRFTEVQRNGVFEIKMYYMDKFMFKTATLAKSVSKENIPVMRGNSMAALKKAFLKKYSNVAVL